MIKAVFFDFDGVLTRDKTGSLTTTRYIGQATGIDPARVKAAFARFNEDLTLGRYTHAEIWPDICRDLQADVDIGVLEQAFASTPLNGEMFALAMRLRPRCVVGVITDNKQDRMDCMERLHRMSACFHPIVVSATVGSTKGDRAIFERALELADVDASECIFIDNDARNLEVPRKMGIVGLHFDDAANDVPRLIDQLRRCGVVLADER